MKTLFIVLGISLALVLFTPVGAQGQHAAKPQAHKHAPTRKKSRAKPHIRAHSPGQLAENKEATSDRLSRIKDDKQLKTFVAQGILVALPENQNVRVDPRLDARYRFTRPWVRKWLNTVGDAFETKFGQPIQVNSASRTQQYQTVLRKKNKNAAPPSGPYASTHLTGSTIDIGYKHMTLEQKKWFEQYLKRAKAAGKLHYYKEKSQAVFHIMVFKPKAARSKKPTSR